MAFSRRQVLFVRLGFALSLVLVSGATVRQIRRLEAEARSPYPVTRFLPFHRTAGLAVASPAQVTPEVLSRLPVPVESKLRRGETVIQVLRQVGLASREAHLAAHAVAQHVDVRRLKAGDGYAIYYDGDSNPVGFAFSVAGEGDVSLRRRHGAWESSWQAYEKSVERRLVAGSLDGFLESTIRQAGGVPQLAGRMSDVLQWDLDFNRDLRLGDRFRILYEEEYLNGEFHRVGEVLALLYENRGRRLEAYRYGEEGHYDASGRPLRKQFLRSPLPYSRVTSRFSHRRLHPILKTYRPHYGVDYGAPAGTPVRVTARGVLTFVGWDKGGGGKTIKVRHANGYLTAYLHLSRYAKGMARGVGVEQGQVIGYVGSTGLATASHLDYRLMHRGRWINPLSLPDAPAAPIPPAEREEFLALRDTLRRELEVASLTSSQPLRAAR